MLIMSSLWLPFCNMWTSLYEVFEEVLIRDDLDVKVTLRCTRRMIGYKSDDLTWSILLNNLSMLVNEYGIVIGCVSFPSFDVSTVFAPMDREQSLVLDPDGPKWSRIQVLKLNWLKSFCFHPKGFTSIIFWISRICWVKEVCYLQIQW